jgi:hypothetical protein
MSQDKDANIFYITQKKSVEYLQITFFCMNFAQQ